MKIASQNTGVISTPNAGGTISLTARNNGCVGITMSVIHIGNDAFFEFDVDESGTSSDALDVIDAALITFSDDGCSSVVVGGLSLLLLLIVLLAIISGYQLRTTRANIAKDIKFKKGSKTFDNGCTHSSVCDVTVIAAITREDTEETKSPLIFVSHAAINFIGND